MHYSQKRQKNFRVAVTDMIFLSRKVSPMAPNTKPNNKRASDGKLARIPALAKSNLSTCRRNIMRVSICDTEEEEEEESRSVYLLRSWISARRSSGSTGPTNYHNATAWVTRMEWMWPSWGTEPQPAASTSREKNSYHTDMRISNDRSIYLFVRNRVAHAFGNVVTLIGGNARMHRRRVGHQDHPESAGNQCDNSWYIEGPSPTEWFHQSARQWPCDDCAECATK